MRYLIFMLVVVCAVSCRKKSDNCNTCTYGYATYADLSTGTTMVDSHTKDTIICDAKVQDDYVYLHTKDTYFTIYLPQDNQYASAHKVESVTCK